MSLTGAENATVAERHASLIERGIYSKSMINSAARCQIAFGLNQGFFTGEREREVPSFALQLGLTFHDLINAWALRTRDGQHLSPSEARQLLSERWESRMGYAPDAPAAPTAKDEKLDALMMLYGAWCDQVARQQSESGSLIGTEAAFGEDGKITLAGIPISGTIDVLWEHRVRDAKVVGQRSQYRRPPKFNYELAHYAALTGKRDAGFIPLVHDLKTPKAEDKSEYQTDTHLKVAGERLERFATLVEAAKKSPGILQPHAKIGEYPCTPKWCGFFGRQCPVTRHLNREDFEK